MPPQMQQDPVALNMMARQAVVNSSVKRTQQIFAQTINPATQTVVNIPPRNVGLILGFIINVRQTVAVAGGGTTLTKTPSGGANSLSQIVFTDLNNNTRIQTTGWHLNLLNSVRGGIPYLAVDALSVTPTPYPVDFGQYYTDLMQCTGSVAATETGTVNQTYFVPLAYSDQDTRGGVFANVVNATMNLQLTINPNTVTNRTLSGWQNAVYCTAASGTAPVGVTQSNVTLEVWQVYYDQLPMTKNGPLLPILDLQTIYELKNTTLTGVVANQDFPIPYSNFRDFLSTCVQYINKTSVTGSFGAVADVNYLTLESANYTNIFKVPPKLAASWGRTTVGLDFPGSSFYIPTRSKPISTVQWGNINANLNCADVQTGAYVGVGFEAFALTNVVGQAQSLAAS